MRITSSQNPVVKYVRSLERVRTRREEGVYLAEGVRLVGEAITTGQEAPIVLYDPAALGRTAAGAALLTQLPAWAGQVYEVSDRVLAVAAQTEHPAGVLAVLRGPTPPPLASRAAGRLGLFLDHLADPGNAGTILRTAAAAGVAYVLASPGSIDLFASKVVRAGMGAHFRLPLYQEVAWPEVRRALGAVPVVAAAVEQSTSIYRYAWPERLLLVIGSEAHGLSAETAHEVSAQVHIPMEPGVESLNAAVAASIMMYQILGRYL